ncbi:NADPH-dependent 7-cyano-7-deazaguanine reductase QueF [Xanthomonas sp. XNM01]|uniref:NADPH-dependent 7-cyano-7-deazaguanine reductase QueF n=1 Tax=Xanthomonas sp. XNM01 TaxID=2769289 RepID=UPI0017802455|nr:NADPH-dependent 7-cyano-7-deazaguanine reductase QueF [Xanthomonas sp. XNM01]MBD9370447.1 NADPH-dependent 7-cyano-7-deazaguanine reductase QueF [Xanthomonas sp. XNM01]
MNTPHDSSLGREVAYPTRYDATLLFPIPRAGARAELGIADAALPFVGHDRWHVYELGWLDGRGKPQAGTATLHVPADSPHLIESKSLKLYLNSLNGARFDDAASVHTRIAADLSRCAGAPVLVTPGLPPLAEAPAAATLIDALDVAIDHYGPPQAALLHADAGVIVEETLVSELLKSNCPVTGQPDWASVHLHYRGPRIDRAALLRYLVSFREHAEFHEQCVERIFLDVLARCAPQRLSVEARYTRRGGLDINPWRGSPGLDAPAPLRDERQ